VNYVINISLCKLPTLISYFEILSWKRNVEKFIIAGYPVRIENKKYHRNQLLFNVGVIIKPETDTSKYEPICRKLGEMLKSLEVRSLFIEVFSLNDLVIARK
jgi:hypothetical protein